MHVGLVSPEEEKEGYDGKDLQKRKVLSIEWKSEELMDDESGESMYQCYSKNWVSPNWRH